MKRTLKLWNGQSHCCFKSDDPAWSGMERRNASVSAAAYSRADLRRLIEEYCGRDPGETEIRDYWNADAWGDDMDGITPERGLWLTRDEPGAKPLRLI